MAHNRVYLDKRKGINDLDEFFENVTGSVQVKFHHEYDDRCLGGIYVYDIDAIICGCCGSRVDFSEIDYFEVYSTWIDLSEEITGGDETVYEEVVE
jgi:hypothetical protein